MIIDKFKNKSPKFYGLIIFILIELALYPIIISVRGVAYTIASSSSILLAFLMPVIFFRKTRSHLLTVCALFFTLVSDLLLSIFFDTIYGIQIASMVSFLIVQVCYFIRIYLEEESKTIRTVHLIVRILVNVLAIVITLIVLKQNANFLAVISVVYYANLLVNVVFSGINFKSSKWLFIGLVLFACCDFFVGGQYIGNFITLSENSIISILLSIEFNMAWLFYLPSQVIISLDITNKKRT